MVEGTSASPIRDRARRLAAVWFCDVVGSTEIAKELGDRRFRWLIDRYLALARSVLRQHGGREIDTAGDGVFAIFDAPAAALRAAFEATAAVRGVGLEIRAGVHLGEVEQDPGGRVGGIAVHIGSRVASLAGPGEVLTTAVTAELSRGAGFRFEDRGQHALKGIPDRHSVMALVEVDSERAEPVLDPRIAAERRDAATAAGGPEFEPRLGAVSMEEPSWPLLGRAHELEQMRTTLRAALAGEGRLLLIGGDPGIGKTRLADELAVEAKALGATVLWGRCWEGAGAPAYWPWVQALRSYLRGTDAETVRNQMEANASQIAQMLPELQELFPNLAPLPVSDPESARFRLFDAATTFLITAARQQPLVIVLDDLQAADTSSLFFLRFVALLLGEARILVVATYRDVELTPDHPLRTMLPELTRSPTTHLLTLGGLLEEDVATFVQRTAHIEPKAQLVAVLHRETKGNPLFLGESLRLLTAEGRMGEVADPASVAIALPSRIRDVIARRIGRLSDGCRRALTCASVLGPEFAIEALRRIGEFSAKELSDVLDEGVREGLLALVPGVLGRSRFTHGLIRETLYAGLSPTRQVDLHRRTAEVLEELYEQDLDSHLAELAHHFFAAATGGVDGKALDFARRAGDQAAASLAYEDAARLYGMALQVSEIGTSDETLRCELQLAFADSQARAGDLLSAKEAFLRAARTARRRRLPRQLARAALGYGGRFILTRAGSDDQLVSLLNDALSLLAGEDDYLRVRLLGRLACALRSSPDRRRSAELSLQALEIARQLEDPSTLAYALETRFWATCWPENPHERLKLATELLAAGLEADDAERVAGAHMVAFETLCELGRMVEARTELEAWAEPAEELRQPPHRWLVAEARTQMALLEGDYEAAERLVAQSRDFGASPSLAGDDLSAARTHLFLLRREQGRLKEVEAQVRASVADLPWYPLHRSILACLLLELGRTREARTSFDELARDGFRALYRDNEWILGMALISEACFMLGDAEAARDLYEQLLPFSGRHAFGFPEGSVGALDRYLGLLAETRGWLDQSLIHLEAGAEMNEQMTAWPWVAHTRFDFARVLLRRGDPRDRDRAEDLLHSARETARMLGMTSLEGQIGALAAPE